MTVEIGRNSLILRNPDLESDEYKKFEKAFSVYDEIYHKYFSSVITIHDGDVYIPASIGENRIRYYFKDAEFVKNYASTVKSAAMHYEMINKPRSDIQKEAIAFLSRMRSNNGPREMFLSLPTGTGKTFVTITMIGLLRKKAMVIVDSIELAEQWKSQFLKHSNLTEDKIKILSGRDSVEDAIKNNNKYYIYIAMHRTLGMLIEEDPNSINVLSNKLKIGTRVFDEAHVNFKNICKINSFSNVEYVIFLTATPSRSNFRDESVYAKVFGSVPYYNGRHVEAVENTNYCNVVLYKYNTNPPLEVKAGCKTPKGFSAALWARYILNDGYEYFIECLKDIITNFKFIKYKKKVAIVLPTIELIKKTKKDLDEFFKIDCGLFIGEAKDRETEVNKQFFITTDKMFDKGKDVQSLEILINFCPFSSLVKLEQMFGRIRYVQGKSHVFIDVTDMGFPSCKAQLNNRKRFYKKKAKSIKEMKL